jgi:hypothetical protein
MRRRGTIYLWSEEPPDAKARNLAFAEKRLKRGTIDRLKREARDQLLEKIRRARYIPRHRGDDELLEEIFRREGVNLDDGYLRLVLVNKWGMLEVWNGERFGAECFGHLSAKVRVSKEMTKLKAGTQTFPWKNPWYEAAVITRVEWVEAHKQYKVFIPAKGSRNIGVTYWFRPRYQKARLGKAWKQPREVSRSVPISPSSP